MEVHSCMEVHTCMSKYWDKLKSADSEGITHFDLLILCMVSMVCEKSYKGRPETPLIPENIVPGTFITKIMCKYINIQFILILWTHK